MSDDEKLVAEFLKRAKTSKDAPPLPTETNLAEPGGERVNADAQPADPHADENLVNGFLDTESKNLPPVKPGVPTMSADYGPMKPGLPIQNRDPRTDQATAAAHSYANSISGGLGPVMEAGIDRGLNAVGPFKGKSTAPDFKTALQEARQNLAMEEADWPKTTLASSAAGAVQLPIIGKSWLQNTRFASPLAKLGASQASAGLTGGAYAALHGAANSEGVGDGDAAQIARDAANQGAKGLMIGTGIGSALPGAAQAAGWLGPKLNAFGNKMAPKALGLSPNYVGDMKVGGQLPSFLEALKENNIVRPLSTTAGNAERFVAQSAPKAQAVDSAVQAGEAAGGKWDTQKLLADLLTTRQEYVANGAHPSTLRAIDGYIEQVQNVVNSGRSAPELAQNLKRDWQSRAYPTGGTTPDSPSDTALKNLAGGARQSLMESMPSSETVSNLDRALRKDAPFAAHAGTVAKREGVAGQQSALPYLMASGAGHALGYLGGGVQSSLMGGAVAPLGLALAREIGPSLATKGGWVGGQAMGATSRALDTLGGKGAASSSTVVEDYLRQRYGTGRRDDPRRP